MNEEAGAEFSEKSKQGRSLYFTPQETLIFGYLFDLADTDDDGLVGGSDGGHALLGRARLPPETLQRLWCEAGGGSPDECLARPQWFVLLALVALAQAGRPCTLRDLLNSCDALASQHQQRQHSNKRRTIPNQPQQHQHSSKQALGQPQQQSRRYRQQLPFEQGQGQSRAQVRLGDSNAAVPQSRPIPDFFLEGFPGPLSTASTGGAQPPAERSGRCTELSSGERGSQEASRDSTGVCRNVREDDRRQGRVDGIEDGDGEDDGYQLEVTVYSHRLVGEGYSSHTEYTVLANASLPGFARREMEVSRRFSDFRWLHGCFRAIPGVLPPPLPPSKWAGSSSRDFVAERMKGLQRYMTRVAQHPVLRRQYALQVFLEGTARGLRAAKALLPVRSPGVGGSSPKPLPLTDTLSPSTPSSNPVSPAVSSSPGIFLPDENSARGFVGRRYTLGGADDLYVPGEASVSVPGGGGVHPRKGQRRSMSFGSSDDNSPHGVGGGGGSVVAAAAGGRGGAAYGSSWPLSYVTNLGYETYGNYVSTSMSTSLTSIKGALGAVKVKARSVVGLAAGPAPIAVESEPVYDAEIAHIEELVAPVSGAVKTVESAAVLKRGVGYEMSRLGHYFTQVASLEDMDGVPPGGVAVEGDKSGGLGGGSGARRRSSGGSREATALVDTAFDGLEGLPIGVRGGATFAKAEQVLGQRMERVATAWLEAIDQEESDFLDPLREQLGYLSSAKEVHRDRVRALDALQDANASLQRNKQRLHAARAQGDTHAAVVATSKMDAAEERMAHAHSRAALIAKTFKTEAKRFHGTRRNEGILAVLELAKAQASFARKANAAWKQVLEDINPTDDELRESQQRVQMPKREARIGEGRSSRTSSRTVGVSTVGGWGGVMGDRGGVGHGHGSRRATDNGFAVRESGGGGGSSSGTSAVANGAISPGSMNRGVTKDGRRRPPNRVVAATGSSTSAARREGGGGGRGLVLGLGLKGLGGLGLGSSRSSEAGSRHAGFVGAARGVWGQAEEVDERRQVHQASMTPPRDIRQSSSGSSLFQLNDNDHDDWEALEQPPTPASVAGVDGPLSIAAEAEPEVTVANAHPPPLPSVRSSVSSAYGVEIFDTSTELAAAASTESVYHEEMGMVDRGQRVSTREEAMRGGGDSGARFTSGVEAMQKGGGLETAENASVAPVEAAFAAGAGGGSEDFVTSQLDSLCLDDVPRPLSVPAPPDNADTGLDRVTIGGGSSSGADEEETMTAVARDVGVVEDYVGGGSEESESKGNELPRPPGAASTDKESVSGTAGTVHRTRSKGPKGGGPEGGGVRVRAISGGGVKRGGGGDSKSATDAIGDDDKTSAFDSGSGSGSGGVGTVASPTTVARLAGSPSPPLRRGDGGDGKGDRETNTGEVVDRIVAAGGAGAPTGLRRVTPTGGRGGARG